MFATNRLNQSRPRPAPATGELARWGSFEPWVSAATSIRLFLVVGRSCGVADGRRLRSRRLHQGERAHTVLVFGCYLEFVLTYSQRHRRIAAVGIEAQQPPFNGNASIPYPQEAAKVDDRDAHTTARIGQHVDDAPEILAFESLDSSAENGQH